MTKQVTRAELHEMHLTFMSTIADLIDALNGYFEDLYGLTDKQAEGLVREVDKK